MRAADEDTISVSKLLQNLSSELGRLEQIAQRLDDVLGDLAVSKQPLANGLPAEVQDVDTLRQSLQALKQIAASAANEVSHQADTDLPKAALCVGVTLGKVRDACLRTHGKSQETHQGTHDTNDPDLSILFDEF